MKYLKYFWTKGRINRIELWWISFVLFLIWVFISIFITGINVQEFINEGKYNFYLIVWSGVIFLLYCFQWTKRYHDLNKWGINGFVWFIIPIANIYFFIQLYFFKGNKERNKYGLPSSFSIDKNSSKQRIGDYYKRYDAHFESLQEKVYKQSNIVNLQTIENILYKKDIEIKFIERPSPDIFIISEVEVNKWDKKDGDIVKKGEKICSLNVRRDYNSEQIDIYAYQAGILKIINGNGRYLDNTIVKDGDKIFEITEVEGSSKYNTPIIEKDDFTTSTNIRWLRVGGNNFHSKELNGFILTVSENKHRVFLTINYIDGKDYIVINFPKSDFDIKSGDKFQFLLESKEVITLSFDQNSFNIYESFDDSLKKMKENRALISFPDIEKLAKGKIQNWKISLQSGQEISGIKAYGMDHEYKSFDKLQEMIQLMFSDYIYEVKKLVDYEPIMDYSLLKNKSESTEECYVYLMEDTANNYFKIGISNKPGYREKTLQSEKPTIEMIANKKFPNRKIASSFEQALHKAYSSNRVRGEWFDLEKSTVRDIITTLSN